MPPRECPSGSEGQTCGENWPDFIPVFVGLKVEKKYIDNICPPESARAVARAEPVRRANFAGFRSGFYWLKSVKLQY